jgi:lipopolysaccharide biosynthesis regulator YciM
MKRKLIGLSLLALIAAIGLGFYMGWFQFSTDNQNNKSNISLSVDRDKLESDKDKAVDAVQDLGQQAKDKVAGTTPKTDDKPVASEQPPQTQE